MSPRAAPFAAAAASSYYLNLPIDKDLASAGLGEVQFALVTSQSVFVSVPVY